MSLYTDLRDAGIPLDNHESDLYVLVTPEACAILTRHGATGAPFVSQIDGRVWLDLPFMFEPWWDARRRA